MLKDYSLEYDELEKIDEELRQFIGVEVHEPFLVSEFSNLFMETEAETPA